MLFLLLGLYYATVTYAQFQFPIEPPFPNSMDDCHQFHEKYREAIRELEEAKSRCIDENSIFPRADAGSCCHQWAGAEAANLGWCDVQQACVSLDSQWYCAELEHKAQYKSCVDKVRQYKEREKILFGNDEIEDPGWMKRYNSASESVKKLFWYDTINKRFKIGNLLGVTNIKLPNLGMLQNGAARFFFKKSMDFINKTNKMTLRELDNTTKQIKEFKASPPKVSSPGKSSRGKAQRKVDLDEVYRRCSNSQDPIRCVDNELQRAKAQGLIVE